eukprot:6796189-Ditylum_brightwellii.AAC.1
MKVDLLLEKGGGDATIFDGDGYVREVHRVKQWIDVPFKTKPFVDSGFELGKTLDVLDGDVGGNPDGNNIINVALNEPDVSQKQCMTVHSWVP